jgi:hypothetical protein
MAYRPVCKMGVSYPEGGKMKHALRNAGVALALFSLAGLGVAANASEVDPAKTCREARAAGPVSLPGSFFILSLEGLGAGFLALADKPGAILELQMTSHDEANRAIVGLFDLDCRLRAWSNQDPSALPLFETESALLTFRVPPEGEFILGFTVEPNFRFKHDPGLIAGEGIDDPQFIVLAPPATPTRTIAGQVTDDRGRSLAGVRAPFSRVALYFCDAPGGPWDGNCPFPVVTVVPDRDGYYEALTGSWVEEFEGVEVGNRYLLKGWALRGPYVPTIVGPFTMGVGEDRTQDIVLERAGGSRGH